MPALLAGTGAPALRGRQARSLACVRWDTRASRARMTSTSARASRALTAECARSPSPVPSFVTALKVRHVDHVVVVVGGGGGWLQSVSATS